MWSSDLCFFSFPNLPPPCSLMKPSMQKLRRIRAALSDSLSSEVGQKASAPSLLESLLTGTPTFSNQDLLLAFVLSQIEAFEEDMTNRGQSYRSRRKLVGRMRWC